jgi:ParB family chromosome partitioning protein
VTSGHFTSFPLDRIHVNRADRQRREVDDIGVLAESIRRTGLINPIVVTRDGELVAGERRLEAVRALGWTSVSVQFAEDLSQPELHVIELEENVKRKNLSWQDECAAVAKYHKLMKEINGEEWTQQRTADALGLSGSEAKHKLAIQQEIDRGNTTVADTKEYSVAKNLTFRANERRKTATIDSLSTVKPEKIVPILNTDFHEWQRTYDGPKFNLIHCDFPYDASQGPMMGAVVERKYEDGLSTYINLLICLKFCNENVIADSAHLMFWFSMKHYDMTLHELSQMGWTVNPFPLIWLKSDNAGVLPDPQRGPRQIYETAFLAHRGDRPIVRAVANAIASPTTREIHMSEKPVPVLTHFMRMLVDENTTFLDPTCGSGTSIRTARALGASRVLGIEKDPDFYHLAKEHYDG